MVAENRRNARLDDQKRKAREAVLYVEKLKIKNFRCFAEAEVSLNYPGREPRRGQKLPHRYPNVTLFIGPNGAGKTTVFKALCLAVLAPVIPNSGLRVDDFLRRPAGYIDDTDVNGNASVELPNADLSAELKLERMDGVNLPVSGERIIGKTVVRRRGDFEEITLGENHRESWKLMYVDVSPAFFLVAYGSNRRSANPEGYSERNRSLRYGRVAGIFEEYFGLVPFTVGYLELDKCGLLTVARNILNQRLPDHVSLSNTVDSKGRPLFNSHGVLHTFNALSDGYRGFVSWIWDLLVQIGRALPKDMNGKASPGQLAELKGVVIVDEIDLFLHPRWQRFLIEEIATEFPNLQFLFSTHSPLVVGMLEAANLRVLGREGDTSTIEQYREEVEGKTPNELLTSTYFGLSSTRSPHSGTLSEQIEREMAEEGATSIPAEGRLRPLNDEQKRNLARLMAQSREEWIGSWATDHRFL